MRDLIYRDELMCQLLRAHLIYENGEENVGLTTICFGSVIKNAINVKAVPIEELIKLRDELYETDAITMRGLALLNRFIEKYSKSEINDE